MRRPHRTVRCGLSCAVRPFVCGAFGEAGAFGVAEPACGVAVRERGGYVWAGLSGGTAGLAGLAGLAGTAGTAGTAGLADRAGFRVGRTPLRQPSAGVSGRCGCG